MKGMPKLPVPVPDSKEPTTIDTKSALDLWGEVERADKLARKVLEDPKYRDELGLPTEGALNVFKKILQFLGALTTMGFMLEGNRFEQYAALHELGSLLKGPLGEAAIGAGNEVFEVEFKNQEKWSKEEE